MQRNSLELAVTREKKRASQDARLTWNVPRDAAAHFGHFYGVQETASKPRPGEIQSSLDSVPRSARTAPRMEFTRQMVHKLERTAGTENYARQVSALLEETVEPAHFKLHSMPAENSIPDGGRHNNPWGYPLWYKEPHKTPLAPDEIRKLLSNESRGGKDIFDEEYSEEDSSEEFTDEQEDADDSVWRSAAKEEESAFNLSSGGSTEAKDTDDASSDAASDRLPFLRTQEINRKQL
nr:uncharacterized protein LOC116428959 [Nomia melanderi]